MEPATAKLSVTVPATSKVAALEGESVYSVPSVTVSGAELIDHGQMCFASRAYV